MIRGIISNLRHCTTTCGGTQNPTKTIATRIAPWNTARHSASIAGQQLPTRYSHMHNWLFKNLRILQRHLSEQCEFVVAQRLRRAYQIWVLYSQLYSDKSIRAMVSKLSRRLATKQRPFALLLGTALFNWEKDNVSDEEMSRCACDLATVDRLLGTNMFSSNSRLKTAVCQEEGQWEFVINKEHLKVWRKPVENSYLFEYKVFGTFYDIPARAFFRVQVDTDYRKKWDQLVIKLSVVDKYLHNTSGESEVIHWVTHYPYPMYSRDYVYVRRFLIDEQNNLMITVSKAINHPEVPVDKNYVRVNRYRSQLCVRPHEHFDKNGFDYVLTYFDDPQASFPGPAYSWMTTSGVPDFVDKLHSATVCLVKNEYGPASFQTRKRSRNKKGGWPLA